MRFTLDVTLGGAAFHDEDTGDLLPGVLADKLHHIAEQVREGRKVGPVLDLNGNIVGNFEVVE